MKFLYLFNAQNKCKTKTILDEPSDTAGYVATIEELVDKSGLAFGISSPLDIPIEEVNIVKGDIRRGVNPHPLETKQLSALSNLKVNYWNIRRGLNEYLLKAYIDCTVNGTTYRMNAGKEAAEAHEADIRRVLSRGEATTLIVDFYDDIHYDIPIEVAKEVALQQADYVHQLFIEYQEKKKSIKNSTEDNIDDLVVTFNVNTL